jgi:hypothetical protein
MSQGPLTEFWQVLRDFKRLGSVALKGAVAAPLADLWLKIGPPPVNVIAVLTSLVEFVAVIWVFHFWRACKVSQLDRRMKIALVVFALGTVVSLALLDRFSVSPGEARDRIIVGFKVLPNIAPILDAAYGPDDALRDNEFDPAKVWTQQSISILRTSITTAWFGTFAALSVYLTAFIMSQRRRLGQSAIRPSRRPE